MLHPAIAPAPAHSWFDVVAVVAAAALTGLTLGVAARSIPAPGPAPDAPLPAVVAALPAATLAAPPAPAADLAPAPAPATAPATPLLFVFDAGGKTYVKLADVEDGDDHGDAIAMPRHGKPRLSRDRATSIVAAVAPVAEPDVPAAHLAWQGRRVEVDEVCTATVVGFAVVSRLVGDPADLGADHWSAAAVLRAGHAVLAARLDRCTGSFARDASLPGFAVPTRRHDAALEAAAREALLASSVAREVGRTWDEQTRAIGGGDPVPWYERAALTSEVLDHPRTGATFVSVHGLAEHGCGDPEANVWGLFRVQPDGTLAPVQLRALGDLEAIDALVDVDGDGQLDILGRPWLGLDRVLARPDGTIIDRLAVPLFGCPC